MPCYSPLKGWRAREPNEEGKYPITFTVRDGYSDLPMDVPCGQCIGCRMERARQWALRCEHEATLHEENCFVTLTYNNESLPIDGGLEVAHVQKFLKRLRKQYSDRRIRYFHCGEYGSKLKRPHYHILLFGIDFNDGIKYANSGKGSLTTSAELQRLWPHGFVSVGQLTPESCAYVARYVTKKVYGEEADEHYVDKATGSIRRGEYISMSRRPGIGAGWIEKYMDDTYKDDTIVSNGFKSQPPRYYDNALAKSRGESALKEIKKERVLKSIRHAVDNTPERLRVREEIKEATLKNKLKRGYEND